MAWCVKSCVIHTKDASKVKLNFLVCNAELTTNRDENRRLRHNNKHICYRKMFCRINE